MHPERAGLLYPGRDDESSGKLAEEIEQAIRALLALKQERGAYRDHRSLLDDFGRSADAIRRATEEARAFLEAVWRTNVSYQAQGELVPKVRDEFLEDYYGRMVKRAASPLIQPRATLSATVETMPVELAETKLRGDLNRAVRRLARGMAEALDHLREAEIIGHINWETPTACDGFCAQDVVIREQLHEEVSRGAEQELHVDYARRMRRVRQEVRRVRKVRHVVRHGVRLFYLSDSKTCRAGDFDQFVPVDIQRLFDGLPPWLKPLIRIVSGTKRTDVVFARDLFVEEREEEKIYNEDLDKRIPRESPFACPVVVLGKHVLAGWGEKENVVEAARQVQAPLLYLGVLLLVLGAGLMGLGQLLHPAFGYLAAVAAPLSLVSFVEGWRERSIARQQPVSWLRLSPAGISWAVLLFGLLSLTVGLASLHWFLICVGGVVVGVGGKMLLSVLGEG